jgi:hypothetical protein
MDIDINNPIDFTFEYEIGLAPEVKVTAVDKKLKYEECNYYR